MCSNNIMVAKNVIRLDGKQVPRAIRSWQTSELAAKVSCRDFKILLNVVHERMTMASIERRNVSTSASERAVSSVALASSPESRSAFDRAD